MPFEIIFSENGSTDNTINLIQTFINDKNNCFMISNDYANYGLALKNGFENAKNEIVISFDIDYFSKKFLKQALQLDENFVALVASKRLSESEDERTIVRKMATSIFVLILKLLFQTSLSDTHGMKAIRKLNDLMADKADMMRKGEKKGGLIDKPLGPGGKKKKKKGKK